MMTGGTRILISGLLGAVLLAPGTPCMAGRLYFGASVGEASADDVKPGDIGDGSSLSGGVDDSDKAWKVYAGYKFLRFFAVFASLPETASSGALQVRLNGIVNISAHLAGIRYKCTSYTLPLLVVKSLNGT